MCSLGKEDVQLKKKEIGKIKSKSLPYYTRKVEISLYKYQHCFKLLIHQLKDPVLC